MTVTLALQPRQGHEKVRVESVTQVHIHTAKNAKECEGMNPYTPKWIPALGIKVSMDFWIFK